MGWMALIVALVQLLTWFLNWLNSESSATWSPLKKRKVEHVLHQLAAVRTRAVALGCAPDGGEDARVTNAVTDAGA